MLYSDGRLSDRDGGQISAVSLDVDDGGLVRGVGPGMSGGLAILEGHRAKIDQGSEASIQIYFRDDPLRVLPTKRMGRVEVLVLVLAIG